jgi:hypothetical protein
MLKKGMKQMSMKGLETVSIDYNSGDVPSSAKEFKPAVYKDRSMFCCILGPNPETGVFGCGDTLHEALTDWDRHLQERIKEPGDGNEVTNYIKDTLAATKWAIW